MTNEEREGIKRNIYRSDIEKLRLFTRMLRQNVLLKKARIIHKLETGHFGSSQSKLLIKIRKAASTDSDQIWKIIAQVIATGDSYVFDPASSKEKMLAYWCGADKHTYVVLLNDEIAGTFVIKDNQPDLGSHIANASYMTSPHARGQGIGKQMGIFSLEEAKRLGYQAMQFNIVVKSNKTAVQLWKQLGFDIIGEIPEAFNHSTDGMTNAYIMHRKL
jgi:L-amino acid N-acyltransferase YncA